MCKIIFSRSVHVFTAFLMCICLLSSANAFSQQTITGTVTDATNSKPLGGATIGVKGGRQNTVTDTRGAFRIVAPGNNAVLTVSYVGYLTQEVPASSATPLSVALAPNSTELNQVVVVGYGTQNKRDITGSVKSVKSEAFNKGIINSPQELLQGKVAGVTVTSSTGEPGSVMGITVRGPGELEPVARRCLW